MSNYEDENLTPEQTERINAERDSDMQVVEIALLRGLRCSSRMDPLTESPPAEHELQYVRHSLGHAIPTIQWAFMQDAARLVDAALLIQLEADFAPMSDLWSHTEEEWMATQSVVRDTVVSILEMLGAEFRELADRALAEDPENQV